MRRAAIPAALALLIAGGACCPASAQRIASDPFLDRNKAQIPDRGRISPDDGRRVLDSYATCLTNQSPSRIAAALATPPGSAAEAAALRTAASPDCLLDGSMRLTGGLLRAALFDAAYRRRFRTGAAPDAAALPRIDYLAEAAGERTAAVALRQFADCVVRQQPATVRTLLMAPVVSDAESRAFAALMPQLGASLPPDETLAFSRPILRGLLAEVLYWLSAIAPGTSG